MSSRYRRIEDFTVRELLERTALQERIAATLHSLQEALDDKSYDEALLHTLGGHRMLSVLVDRQLAIEDEHSMLAILRYTAGDILRLQHRMH